MSAVDDVLYDREAARAGEPDELVTCARPACGVEFVRARNPQGGRPRRYHTDQCRRLAQSDRRRTRR